MHPPEQYICLVEKALLSFPRREWDELRSVGLLALVEACSEDRLKKGAAFGGYIRIRVRGAMLEALRCAGYGPRSNRTEHAELDENRFAAMELGPEESTAASELRARLAVAVSKLPERWQRVIEERYVKGTPSAEVSKGMGVCESRSAQIHMKLIKRLRVDLEGERS